ncbi:secretin N-terminal domain-containing protein, partial [Rhodosalinus sp.]|uniref:secretin N-terminal domain-containing protein n=1 Tax=Rhodosalinus sp. TaxID=2047741 RepID=UPI00397E6D5A
MQLSHSLGGFVAGAFLALGIVLAQPAQAQGQPAVDNVFFQTDLRTALEDVAAQTGENIVADPSVQGIVTATIENRPLDEAIELLLAGTPYRLVRQPTYYLVYNPDIRTDLFAQVARTEILDLRHLPAETARELLVEPLRKYVRADTGNGRLVVTAPPDLLRIVTEDVAALDRPNTEQTVFMALTHVSAENARELLPSRLQGYVRVDAERNSLSVSGPASARQEAIGLIRRLDRPLPPKNVDTRNVYQTRLIKLDHITAEAVMNLLPESLNEFVRADNSSNTLSVNAPPNVARQIHADIADFDQARRHIMLEARVVVLDTNAFLDIGTEFQPPGLSAGLNRTENMTEISEIALGYTSGRAFTNALTLTLNLLSENNQASIVASPQVLAQDGLESEIRVTTAEFFQILSDNEAFIRSDLEEIETGTILRITPQVGRDGTLTLDMELEVSDVVARGERNLPVVNRRTVENTV